MCGGWRIALFCWERHVSFTAHHSAYTPPLYSRNFAQVEMPLY